MTDEQIDRETDMQAVFILTGSCNDGISRAGLKMNVQTAEIKSNQDNTRSKADRFLYTFPYDTHNKNIIIHYKTLDSITSHKCPVPLPR